MTHGRPADNMHGFTLPTVEVSLLTFLREGNVREMMSPIAPPPPFRDSRDGWLAQLDAAALRASAERKNRRIAGDLQRVKGAVNVCGVVKVGDMVRVTGGSGQ